MSRRRVSWVISANIDNWQKNLNKAQRSMHRFANNMQRMGRTMTTFVTAPIVAAGGASLKMAADFDSSMSKIEGLVGVARSEVDRMRESVLGLSGETARAPQELADAMFFITSAGNRGAQATELLEMSARGAAAGLGETKDIAHLASSAIAAYGKENLNASQAMDVLVGAVREGKAEASELATSMGMVLPIASEMGVTFDQVGAAVAAMTRTGTDAGTASMQLRQILASLIKPSNQAEQAMADMGTSSAELRRQLREEGLITVLGFLKDQMEDNEQAMSQVFPNIRALSGALDLMGSNAEDTRGIFNRMTDTTGLLEKAFAAATDTAKHQFNQAISGARSEMIRFGTIMMPVATQVLEMVQRVIGNFARMEDEMRKKIIVMAGLLGAAGPLMMAIAVAVKIMAAFASVVVLKMGLIAGAFVAGVAAGQWMVDNWEKLIGIMRDLFVAFVNDTIDGIGLLLQGINFFVKAVDPTRMGITPLIASLENLKGEYTSSAVKMTSFTDSMKDGMKTIGQFALDVTGANKALEAFMSLFDQAPAKIDETSDNVGKLAKRINIVGQSFKGISQPVVDATRVMTEGVDELLKRLQEVAREGLSGWTKFTEGAKAAGVDFVNFLASEMTSAFVRFGEVLGNALAGAGDEWATTFEKIIMVVIDFAKSLARLAIAIGAVMMFIPGFQSMGTGLMIAGTALTAAATFAGARVEQNQEGRRATSVNDALIRSDGSIVHLNPQDNILAMKDFGNLSKKVQIFPVLELDGRTIWEAQKAYEVDL